MSHPVNFATLSDKLADEALSVCQTLYPRGTLLPGKASFAVGDLQGGPGLSLVINLKGSYRGRWKEWSSLERGDMLDLVAGALGISLKDAANWARSRYGLTTDGAGAYHVAPRSQPRDTEAEEREAAEARAKKQARALKAWYSARSIEGTPAEDYLRRRGITCALPETLKFHPALWHDLERRTYRALVCAVQMPDRKVSAIWRIYLDDDGPFQAPVKNVKLGLGPSKTGACRLGPAGDDLAICEGVETGLSVMSEIPELPVWAALSTSGMVNLELPRQVRRVQIFADRDAMQARNGKHFWPGQDAAAKLRNRCLREGRQVKVILPPAVGEDFNDLVS